MIDRHRNVIIGVVIAALVSFVAYYFGYKPTQDEVRKVKGDVTILQRESPCTPKPNGEATDPIKCAENFAKGFTTLTPIQACRFLQKGSTVITVDGHPIGDVRCTPSTRSSRKGEAATSQNEAGRKTGESSAQANTPPASTTEPAGPPTPDHPHANPPPHHGSGGPGGGSEGGSTGGAGGGGGGSSEGSPSEGSTGSAEGSTAPTESPKTSNPPPPTSTGGSAVGVEVLPESGGVVSVEVLPEHLPLPLCTPIIKLNCR